MGLADDLRELAQLHDEGILSDAEFAEAKATLLRDDPEAARAPVAPKQPPPQPPPQPPHMDDYPGVTWTSLESVPKYRRFPSGVPAMVACDSGHVQSTASDFLNLWLERRSAAGKLQRFGNRAQHVGNVMTPGVGTMLAGRSGRRIQAQQQQDLMLLSQLQCNHCGLLISAVAL